MSKNNLMSLDLSLTNTGVGLFVDGKFKKTKLITPPRKGEQIERFCYIVRHVNAIIKKYKITHVCYENAFGPHRASAKILDRLTGSTIAICELERIPFTEVNALTVKKFATGNGKASKDDMIAQALKETGKAMTNDEADAYFVGMWCLANVIK